MPMPLLQTQSSLMTRSGALLTVISARIYTGVVAWWAAVYGVGTESDTTEATLAAADREQNEHCF